ncbi:uncharacterized protein YaeQ [Sphaerotilus hippei]|uniref:Uncharacterized protein YaeQ n=1 Tax=Sphaerotilus hippei TaxID=744406 RepID=A0A318GUL8_9BURK|nr:YaeQ family protein [Sphaerotilus hippei]PXW92364.1 uncharacterized protein YaeQ [Sphaerotilus hippei]
MAIRSTIYKAELSIADIERNYYADHQLTVARHPSETEERLMVRLVAFAMHAHEALALGGDISTDDEPALWRRALTGDIEQWIEVGLPDERLLRKACGRADEVVALTYGARKADLWWTDNANALGRQRNLTVWNLTAEDCESLVSLCQRSMRLGMTIQDGQILIASGAHSIEISPVLLQKAAGRK